MKRAGAEPDGSPGRPRQPPKARVMLYRHPAPTDPP